MADEIKVNVRVEVALNSFVDRFAPGQISFTPSVVYGGNPGTVSIGTAEEDIAFGDVTPGLIVIRNLDATNFVKFGPKSGGSMVLLGKIPPGRLALFELGASAVLRMQADTATCLCLIKGYAA